MKMVHFLSFVKNTNVQIPHKRGGPIASNWFNWSNWPKASPACSKGGDCRIPCGFFKYLFAVSE